MIRGLLLVAVIGVLASGATGSLDTDPDSFGVYFDPDGLHNTITQAPFTTLTAYIILMNPSGPTDGFECTMTRTGGVTYVMGDTYPCPAIDVDAATDGFAVGSAFPFPEFGNAMVLCSRSLILASSAPVSFGIGPANIPSMPGRLPVVTGDGVLRLCGVASGDIRIPVAIVNGGSPVAVETSTFGALKSQFR